MCTPIFLLFPAIAGASTDTARLVLLVCANSAVQLIQSSMFTANFSIINNSVVTAQRGSVNGLAMGIASFFKATGPMAGTALFAWSLTNGLPSPLDVHFCYALMCGIATITALLARRIPASLSSPLPEPDHSEVANLGVDGTARNEEEGGADGGADKIEREVEQRSEFDGSWRERYNGEEHGTGSDSRGTVESRKITNVV